MDAQNQTIASDSEDDDELVFSNLAHIKGQDVKSVAFKNLNFQVHFKNDFSLEIITNSSPLEQWELRRSDGYRFGFRDHSILVEEQVDPD